LERVITIFLIFALVSTFIAIPLLTFTPQIYGRPRFSLSDLNFIKDYIVTWWHKIIRRYVHGEVGQAENVTPSPEQPGQSLSEVRVTDNPQTAAEVIKYIQKHQLEYSYQILEYVETHGIPNKPAQFDVLIVPENIYVTFQWDGTTLTVYDGWQGDLGCNEWVQVTLTSDVLMQLWNNRNDVETCKSIILQAEANGDISYSIKRVNPVTAETVLWFQILSCVASIFGWVVVIMKNLAKKTGG